MEFPNPGLEELYRTHRIGVFAVNSKETKVVFATDLSGKYNIWGMDLPNTFPHQVTFVDQRPSFVEFEPNGEFLFVGFDHDGDENQQIYVVSTNGGRLMPVRVMPGKRHDFGALSKDGRFLYYSSDKENARCMNIYRYDVESDMEHILVEGKDTTVALGSVAPDESSFVFEKLFANTFILSYLDIEGDVVCLTPDETVVQVSTGSHYVDERTVIFCTNYNEAYAYLASYDVILRKMSIVLQLEGKDITRVQVSRDGTVYCIAENGVEDEVYQGSMKSKLFERIEIPGAVVFGWTLHQSGRLYAVFSREDEPSNLYRREFDKSWTKLTNLRVAGTKKDTLVRAQVIRYPSFDGLQIEAMFFKAHAGIRNGHLIVLPHGGPQAADRKWFWSLSQFLLLRGYDIFSPNFRGSTGYGAGFTTMIERDWGGAPRQDVIAGIEYLIEKGIANRDKLFVLGASYGGYMTLILHGRHANYFRAAVDIFGPSNLFTFYESVPEFWKPLMDQWVGNPERDKEKMIEDSPITYLDNMTKPMLVIQGANDPRVVMTESNQIVDRLRALGRNVEYMVLEDEGHGFSKKENELKVYKTVVEFLDRHQLRDELTN